MTNPDKLTDAEARALYLLAEGKAEIHNGKGGAMSVTRNVVARLVEAGLARREPVKPGAAVCVVKVTDAGARALWAHELKR
jgi:hypothetical protein